MEQMCDSLHNFVAYNLQLSLKDILFKITRHYTTRERDVFLQCAVEKYFLQKNK